MVFCQALFSNFFFIFGNGRCAAHRLRKLHRGQRHSEHALRTGIQHHAAVCAKLIEISRKDRRTNDRHCVLYSPLFFRKITPSVLPEHLFWGRNAGRAWLLLVYMKTRKKSNPEPCFSRKSLKPAPGYIQNPFQNQKRPDRPARFRGTVWPRIQLTGFMLAGSSTGTG